MIKHEQPNHVINATYEDIKTSRKFPQEITFGFCGSPYGRVFVAKTRKGLCNLEFIQHDEDFYMHKPGKKFTITTISRDDEFASATVNKIYNSNDKLNLHLVGTQFQLKVWQALLNLGRDRVCSYTEIAQQAGFPDSVRAVANAIGKNPVHYLVPCHRVVRKNGSLGGYAGGLDKKKQLLAFENLCPC